MASCFAGLPAVTAEREEAIRRADEAEHAMRNLVDQRNRLLSQLEALSQSSPSGPAPVQGSSEAAPGPAPESAPEEDPRLQARIAELTLQVEEVEEVSILEICPKALFTSRAPPQICTRPLLNAMQHGVHHMWMAELSAGLQTQRGLQFQATGNSRWMAFAPVRSQ